MGIDAIPEGLRLRQRFLSGEAGFTSALRIVWVMRCMGHESEFHPSGIYGSGSLFHPRISIATPGDMCETAAIFIHDGNGIV